MADYSAGITAAVQQAVDTAKQKVTEKVDEKKQELANEIPQAPRSEPALNSLTEEVDRYKAAIPELASFATDVANNVTNVEPESTYVGDGGYMLDLAQEQPERPAPRLVTEEDPNAWINDLGQIQGANQLQTNEIAEDSVWGRRGNNDFDWSGYYGTELEKPTETNFVGENGYLYGNDVLAGYGATPDFKTQGADVIDDGTNAYANRTSAWITAGEARRQAEAQGNQEMLADLEYVPDDTVLSKTNLEADYGYNSYVPDAKTKFQRGVLDVADAYNQLVGGIGQARGKAAEKWTSVDVGGQKHSIEDVNKELRKIADERQQALKDVDYDPMKLPGTQLTSKETGASFKADDVNNWVIGADNVLYALMDNGDRVAVAGGFEDGDRAWTDFLDIKQPDVELFGEQVDVNDIAKYTQDPSILANFYTWETNDELKDRAQEGGQNINDNVITGKPIYATQQMVEYNDDGSFKKLNVPSLYNLGDMLNQSISWFNPVTQAANIGTGMVLSGSGIDPMASSTGDYQTVGELATAAPMYGIAGVGESALGGIGAVGGKGIFKIPLEKMLGRKAAHPLNQRVVIPIVTEAAEEVTMNPVWDYAADGAVGWGANPVTDEYGNEIGIDEETPLADRIWNEAQQIPEGALGGALMGGAIGTAGAAKAKMTGQYGIEKRNYRQGFEIPKPKYVTHKSETQKIIDHETERTRF